MVTLIKKVLRAILSTRPRIIFDTATKLGNFCGKNIGYRTDLLKEDISRQYVMNMPGTSLKFLDVGGKDGALTYLLGIHRNLQFDPALYADNKSFFDAKYDYFGVDVRPSENKKLLVGDVCSSDFLERHGDFVNFFDVIYSNNVFEHLRKPWVAAENLSGMLKAGGIVITVVPFSQRYHEDPEDFFRYTHKGIISLFEDSCGYDVLEAGYDISGRRTNWQGSGENNDLVPLDQFGAWRETWFAVAVMRKC
ncbi:MAG: class I SAM-dependent methyltransferase [Nitrospira sp.]|jgi:SAM-dependent methyltransferase|nr:class I SAM-dependent methyltransferase [Nitrospira sp.]